MSIPGLGPIIASATVAAIGAGARAPYQPHRPRALVPTAMLAYHVIDN